MTGHPHAPVLVNGEVIASKRVGAYRHLTLSAPGVPERFRAGNFVMVAVGERLTRLPLWIHRVRHSSAFGPTLDVVVEPAGDGRRWLAQQPVGAAISVIGPLGRPFALPKGPASCLLVGEDYSAATLFPLAERLRERGASVTLAIGARDEEHLLSATEARRWVRSVTVLTADGSVGVHASVREHIGELVERSNADVVYASGSRETLRAVAAASEQAGVWSQVALETPMACGTGLCHGCGLGVVGEDGVGRIVRGCTEGPVVRGDRVSWGTP